MARQLRDARPTHGEDLEPLPAIPSELRQRPEVCRHLGDGHVELRRLAIVQPLEATRGDTDEGAECVAYADLLTENVAAAAQLGLPIRVAGDDNR